MREARPCTTRERAGAQSRGSIDGWIVSDGAPPRGRALQRRVATRFARPSIPLPGPQAAAGVLQVSILVVMHGASDKPFKYLFEPLNGAAPKGHLVLLLDQSPGVRPRPVVLMPLVETLPRCIVA
jgi:hypothetical protein